MTRYLFCAAVALALATSHAIAQSQPPDISPADLYALSKYAVLSAKTAADGNTVQYAKKFPQKWPQCEDVLVSG